LSNIVNMQAFVARKLLQEQVLPFFRNLNPSFEHFKENFEIAFVLQHYMNVVVFIKFIPANEFTELPTLQDSFQDIRTRPRVSTGEWVVQSIFELPFERINAIMSEIVEYASNPVTFLKQEVKK